MLRRRCSRVLHRVPSLQEYKNEHELHEHHGAEYRCGKPGAPRRAKAYHPAKIRRDDPSRSTKLHSAATPTLKSATLRLSPRGVGVDTQQLLTDAPNSDKEARGRTMSPEIEAARARWLRDTLEPRPSIRCAKGT